MEKGGGGGGGGAIETISIEISAEGVGRILKGAITERGKGFISWIHFGDEGLRTLLKGVEFCCKEETFEGWHLEWKETGRAYRLERRANVVGRFLQCSVRDREGKRHRIFVLEGRGLVRGWVLFEEKLRELRVKVSIEEKGFHQPVDTERGKPLKGSSFSETVKKAPRNLDSAV